MKKLTNFFNCAANGLPKTGGGGSQPEALTIAGQFSQKITMTLGGASIQHPFSIHSASIGTRWQAGGWKYILSFLLVLAMSIGNVWGDTEATISVNTNSSYSSAYYLVADGTAISAIAGSGAAATGTESGPKAKITVTASVKTATLTFTIPSGITITSFKVNGDSNSNVDYDLDGTAVTIGTALSGLSKTSSMVFTLTCKDVSGSSNRNTKISSINLTYTSSGGGGSGSGTGTGTVSWAITTNTQTLTPTISGAGSSKLSNASTTLSLTGLSTTSSSKSGYCKPFYGTVVDCPANDDYASVSFKVANGYTFTPSSLSLTCFSNNSGNLKYKAVISDATYTITSNELQPSSGGEGAITFASNAFTGKALTGTVTIKLFTYGLANSSSGTRSYIKSPIEINGTVAEAAPSCDPIGVASTGTATSVTYNSASLPFTMDKTTGVSKLTIEVFKNSDNTKVATYENITPATSGSQSATGLDASTTYYYKITTVSSGGDYCDGATTEKSATFTTSAAPATSWDIAFDCNGATSGCPSILTSQTALPNPLPSAPTKTGYTFSGWFVNSDLAEGHEAVAGAAISEATTLYAKWTAKTTSLTLNPNTANHGTGSNVAVTATYGSVLPAFSAAVPVSMYVLSGYYTAATEGTKIINADGTLVSSTTYADEDKKWASEESSLELFAQYEADSYAESPYTITMNSSVRASGSTKNGVYLKYVGSGDITDNNGIGFGSNNSQYVHVAINPAMGHITKVVVNLKVNTASDNSKGVRYVFDDESTISSGATIVNFANTNYNDVEFTPSDEEQTKFTITRVSTTVYVKSVKVYFVDCTTPTSPSISGTTDYSAGENISLTASATGATSATFTWYKGADWATASAGSSIGTGATLAINSCTTDDAGTYWCNISNGTSCEVQTSKSITVASCTKPGTPGTPSVSNKTHNSADLSWAASANSDGYKVSIIKTDDESVIVDWTDCATNSYAASGLDAETEYTFKVKAVGASGYCDFGSEASVDFTTNADPCHTYFWFSKAADATGAHVTNNEGDFFTTAANGTNSAETSITIDEVVYAITNRSGNIGADDAVIATFTIPANKAGTFYTNMSSSGNKGESSNRTLYLKKSGVAVYTATNAIYGDGDPHNATIENIVSGTYTLHANNNVKVGMFAVKACDATYRTVSFDSDGGSSVSSLSVLDGTAATKPADPTKDNCIFAGWYNGGDAYVWSTAVTADLALTAHWTSTYAVTYSAGDGSGEMTDSNSPYVASAEVTLMANAFTAPSGKEFDAWVVTETVSGDAVSVTNGKFTMPAAAVTVTATWKDLPAYYTLEYYDGESKLGDEQVVVGSKPTASGITTTKEFYNFEAWQLSGVDKALTDASWTSVAKDATVTLTARYTGNYFTTSVDFEEGGSSAVSGIAAKNIVASAAGEYDGGKASENWAYKGWKIKSNGATVKVLVQAGKQLTYKFGYLDATGHVSITNDATTYDVTGASNVEDNPLKYTTYSWIKAYDAVYTFTTGNSGAAVIKALTVQDVYNVTYTDGTGDASGSASNVTEVTLPTPTETDVTVETVEYTFTGWKADKAVTVDDEEVAANTLIAAGKTAVLGANTIFTAQWAEVTDFDVKFYQGYGEPDVQIGETQSISTGNYATAPATDPTRSGYRFLGWSYDGTVAHIVTVGEYAITAATNFTAMWIQQFTVTFDGAGAVVVDNGATVASPNSPVTAGKVFQGWYNGESKYNFSAAVTGNLALESKWADADANHYVYAYNDDFHFDGVVYKTPEGATTDPTASEATNNLTTPYTLFSGASGITSIVATKAVYDYKKGADTKHITAYLKLKKSSDDANSKLIFTIASGYTAVLKVKMGGYSNNPTVTLKKGDDAITAESGTIGGTATGKNYNEITYNLTSGVYEMTTSDQTLYFSNIDLEATALPGYTVTYKAGDGTGDDVVDNDATEVADCPNTFTAPTGKVFNGWKDALDNDVTVGDIVSADMTLTAQWIYQYAVTFNMNGHGAAIAAQNVLADGKATKPADPSEMGYNFGGWFTDTDCTEGNEFDFNTAIAAATPLYAKWTTFTGCVELWPATSGDALHVGDNVSVQSGSKGGTIAIVGMKTDGSSIAYNANGLYLSGGGKDSLRVTIGHQMQVGTKITVALRCPGTGSRGLNLLNITGGAVAGGTMLGWSSGVTDAEGTFSYTVTADDGLDGTKAFRLQRNNTIYFKYVTVEDCAPQDFTVTYKDGASTLGTEFVFENEHPTATGIATRKNGYVFEGWAETDGGSVVDLDDITITADKTLYAVYSERVCATSGSMFKFQMKTDLTNGNVFSSAPNSIAATTDNYLATLAGGEVTFSVTGGNNRLKFFDQKAIGFDNGEGGSIAINLDCPLAANDVIRYINYASTGNKTRLSDGTHNLDLDGNGAETVQEIAVPADFVGTYELTLTRANNTAKITSFEIYRRPILTGVTMDDLRLKIGKSATPVLHLNPSEDALVTSQAWAITASTATGTTINTETGLITAGETAGELTVQVTLNGDKVASATVTIVPGYESVQPVSETTTWQWEGVLAANTNIVENDTVLANYYGGGQWEKIAGKQGEYAYRAESHNCYQGTYLYFRATVPGILTIYARNASSCSLNVNGSKVADLTSSYQTLYAAVPAGNVFITSTAAMRIKSMKFDTDMRSYALTDNVWGGYERNVDPQYYGTVCLPKAGVMTGATLFQVAYMDYKEDGETPYKVYYDEVENGTMQAGMPYIFLAEQSTIGVYYTGTAEETAKDHNGLHGTLVNITEGMNAEGIYMFYNNRVVHSTNAASKLPANRAYLQISEIPGYGDPNYQAPAPTRRRISTGFNGANGATGLENIQAVEGRVQKVLIDGKIYILRGEKIFDATGRLVK